MVDSHLSNQERLRPDGPAARPDTHFALFYSDDEAAREQARAQALQGLRNGEFVLIYAPESEASEWSSLVQELEAEARAERLPGTVAGLYFAPATSERTVRMIDEFLKVARVDFLRPDARVRVFARLRSAPYRENENCSLDITCEECSTTCLYHLVNMKEALVDAGDRRTTLITALAVGPHAPDD